MSGRSENRARMERLVWRWRQSRQCLSSFARQHGVTRDKLQYWSRKLSPSSGHVTARREPSALVPVQLVGGTSDREAALEVVLAGGDRVLLRAAVPLELVEGVISILRQRC